MLHPVVGIFLILCKDFASLHLFQQIKDENKVEALVEECVYREDTACKPREVGADTK